MTGSPTESNTEANTKADTKADTEADTEADTAAPAQADTAAPAQADTAAEAEADTAAPAQADTAAEAEAEAEAMVAELRDRWQRAQAELDNTRKRYERQLADRETAERARVAAEWLPVLDNLERALSHAEADPRAVLAGIAAVREQALSVLERLGIRRIDDTGARFDPSRHEAAQVVDTSDAPDTEPGTVVAVLQPGYTAADGLLRPAVVAVARKPD